MSVGEINACQIEATRRRIIFSQIILFDMELFY